MIEKSLYEEYQIDFSDTYTSDDAYYFIFNNERELFLTKDKVIKCPGLKVEAHSTVGAGDAMVAALSFGLDQGLDLTECARLGLAASAGAVTTKGTKPPKRELVDELMKKVEVIEL